MRIAVIGSSGQLGKDLVRVLAKWEVQGLSHADIEITEKDSITAALARLNPEVVINTAAFNLVDNCEEEDEKAFRVNALGPKYLARECHRRGTVLVHISTDYVFGGEKSMPYTEEDHPHPLSSYGLSKLAGEYFVSMYAEKHYIVRTAGLYGLNPSRSKGGSFADKMLAMARSGRRARVVCDQILTPTYTADLAEQIEVILERSLPFGLYHATNDGQCSWYDFAREIFRHVGREDLLEKTTSTEWKAPARRPPYSVLANAALRKHGSDIMPSWRNALARYLAAKVD